MGKKIPCRFETGRVITTADSRLASNAVVSSLFDGVSTHRTIYPQLDPTWRFIVISILKCLKQRNIILIDRSQQGRLRCLPVEIFQRYQLNFTTLLCLKKSIRESAFRKDIIMIVVAFSKYRCVILHQIEFIHTNFFISVLARTDDIVLTLSNAVSNCSKDKIR